MGHYDSAKEKTWEVKECNNSKLPRKKKKKTNNEHDWNEITYGVMECTKCGKIMYTT